MWYRVAELKPCLRGHIEMHRHDYRGLIWYILEDKSSGRNHRFSTSAYQIIGLMDGERSVNRIWEAVNVKLGDFAPTQDEVIQLLGQLHQTDLLQCEVSPDSEELFQRHNKQSADKVKQVFRNPLSQKIPLWDPDDFLERMLPRVAWLFHWSMGLVWVSVVLLATLLAGIYWDELSGNFIAHSLSPYNLLILCLVYPCIKFLHELGHAFSTIIEGGEVHEMGVIFLVLMPIPYVNVTSSSTFRSKRKRMLVGAAGILVELFLAALGLFLWLSVEPGLVREIAFNVALTGGISSLFFNGNPLLKYDGYYVLADGIGIPNLYQRSSKYLSYLCQRYLFGIKELTSPAMARGEAGWFVGYGIVSFCYRMAILWVIILYITETFFIVGILLAVWMVTMQIVLPIAKGILHITTSPGIQKQRFRAVGASTGLLAVLFILITLVPTPSYTMAEGVVRLTEDAHLRSETEGFLGELLVVPDSDVKPGTPLVQIDNPFLPSEVKVLEFRLKELQAQYHADWFNNRVQAGIIKEDIRSVEADLENTRNRARTALIRSPKEGKLLIPMAEDQPGRFIRQGELIGYVIDDSTPTARVVVTQVNIGQMRKQIVNVQVRLANHLDRILSATILREVPEATNRLPSAALASTGGGLLTVDPNQPDGLTTSEKIFQFDIEFSPREQQLPIGTRVFVRFDHGSEPLAEQWYRSIRQLFLRQFNV